MVCRVRVKVCGITRLEDLDCAIEVGVDAIGLNFYPHSPRYVSTKIASQILRQLPPFVEPVGVFVRQRVHELQPMLQSLQRLQTVQIHGGITEPQDVFPIRYIPAFQVGDRTDVERVKTYLEECNSKGWLPYAVLVDGHAPGLIGGTGVTAPWHCLAEANFSVPLILAGGLTPENVAEAIRTVRPYAVDVASGVESQPGLKDANKIHRFVEAVRSAL